MDFAQFRASAADLPGPDEAAAAHTRAREATLTKPPGSLGRLEALAEWAARWQGRSPPAAERIQVLIFAGNHGVAAQGVSAYSAQVTAQMVANFAAGGAAINQLADALGAHLDVHALDLARPTVDFTQGPAMSEAECAEALATGMNRVDPAAGLLCLGEMGIGNTTSAAALCYAVLGGEAADWVGPGTGMSGDALANKIQVVETAVARAQSDDPLAQLAQVGGREIAALTGAVLGARKARIPVVLDGFICTAAAVPLFVLNRSSLDHCLAGHRATEPGHGRWPGDRLLVIHCLLGVSRSPAAGLAVMCQRNLGREAACVDAMVQAAPGIRPNRAVLALADDVLGCEGRLMAAVKGVGTGEHTGLPGIFTVPV